MDIQRKLEITKQSIESITAHTDVDADVRRAALNKVKDQVDAGLSDINCEVAKATAEALGSKE